MGIMEFMIDELDVISRDKGWSRQGLGVWPNNLRAIRAYERLGFYKVGEPLQSRSRPEQLYQPMFRHLPSPN
jgi:ribosomal protein S18 acetylase RimI-like enzyme